MRVSVDPMDPGYKAGIKFIDAYVGKVLHHNCITVDEEKGFVVIFDADPATGSYRSINGVAQRIKIEGDVVLAGQPYTRGANAKPYYND